MPFFLLCIDRVAVFEFESELKLQCGEVRPEVRTRTQRRT